MDIEESDLESSVSIALAVDYWKLIKVCERLMAALPEEKRKRIEAQLRFSANRLETHLQTLHVELHTFEGQQFGPELPVIAVNAGDFESAQNLLVESAVEPAIIMNNRVLQNARVVLKEDGTHVFGN